MHTCVKTKFTKLSLASAEGIEIVSLKSVIVVVLNSLPLSSVSGKVLRIFPQV
jgi:hypothetical protein